MSPARPWFEVIGLWIAPGFLVGLALTLGGITLARRIVPARPLPETRWQGLDLVLVLAVGLLAVSGAALLLPGEGVVDVLLATELGFVLALVPVLLVVRSSPAGLAALGLARGGTLRSIGAGLVLYASGFLLLHVLEVLWAVVADAAGWEPHNARMLDDLAALEGAELALALGIGVVVGPLLEELLFRGFLQSFATQFLGRAGGVVLTAVLFALMHGLAAFGPILVLALLLGGLQLRTQRLAAAFVVHAFHNGLMLWLALRWGVR